MENRIWYQRRQANDLGWFVHKHFPNWDVTNKYAIDHPDFNLDWVYLGGTPWSFQNKTWDELSPQLKAEWIASDYQCPELITKVFWPAIEELEKQCRDFEETVMKLSDKIWNLENPDDLDGWEEVGDPIGEAGPEGQPGVIEVDEGVFAVAPALPAHNHRVEFDLPDPQQDL